MTKKEIGFEKFINLLDILFQHAYGIGEQRTKNYKRGSVTLDGVEQILQNLQQIKSDRPPKRSKDDIKSTLATERQGNPLFLHKIIIDAPFFGKPSFQIKSMEDEEAVEAIDGKF